MKLRIAASIFARAKGAAGGATSSIKDDEVLMLVPCHDIHTFTMTRPIDVAFVNEDGIVCRTYCSLMPNQRISCPGAVVTLERLTPVEESLSNTLHEEQDKDDWFHIGDRVCLGSIDDGDLWTLIDAAFTERPMREAGERKTACVPKEAPGYALKQKPLSFGVCKSKCSFDNYSNKEDIR